jgi:hypothetical protein
MLVLSALLRGRGQRYACAVSQPPKLRDQLTAAGTLPHKCHIYTAGITNGVHAEAPQLPRHADFCFVSTKNAMTMLQVMGNGRLAI